MRNQCTGFLYGLSVADAWIRTGQYKRVLLVGSEVHSTGMDLSTRGRELSVLFGDGAGVAILGPTGDDGRGVLSTHIFADGRYAELLFAEQACNGRAIVISSCAKSAKIRQSCDSLASAKVEMRNLATKPHVIQLAL